MILHTHYPSVMISHTHYPCHDIVYSLPLSHDIAYLSPFSHDIAYSLPFIHGSFGFSITIRGTRGTLITSRGHNGGRQTEIVVPLQVHINTNYLFLRVRQFLTSFFNTLPSAAELHSNSAKHCCRNKAASPVSDPLYL
jgi:hypothetical protein